MAEKLKITQGISLDVGHYPSEVDTFLLYLSFQTLKYNGFSKKYDNGLIKIKYQY